MYIHYYAISSCFKEFIFVDFCVHVWYVYACLHVYECMKLCWVSLTAYHFIYWGGVSCWTRSLPIPVRQPSLSLPPEFTGSSQACLASGIWASELQSSHSLSKCLIYWVISPAHFCKNFCMVSLIFPISYHSWEKNAIVYIYKMNWNSRKGSRIHPSLSLIRVLSRLVSSQLRAYRMRYYNVQ